MPPSSLIIELRKNPVATTWSCVRPGKQVAGNLLDDELVVGQVAVEGPDDPVAIEVDLAGLVFLVAVGIGIAGGIEPDPRPALAVMRRVEQPLDQPVEGVIAAIGQEGVNLLDCRRQPGQVEAKAADEGGPIGLGGRRKAFLFQAGEHEGVDRDCGPTGC